MRAGVRAGRIVTTAPADREKRSGPARRDDAHYVYRRHGPALPGLRHRDPDGGVRRPPALLVPDLPGGLSRYSVGVTAGRISWKVRPLAGVPMAVIAQPEPERVTLAITSAVWSPEPASV